MRRAPRAFTVIELLVAVGVLLAVIIATSKIFNTASKVSSTGEANADVLQQSSVLEEQMRRDLQRICRDGYFAIQCVEVPNNVNQASDPSAPLLNPQLAPNALLRCDQVVFFTAGTETSARWAGPADLVRSGGGQQARATMVRYSHGVQVQGLPNDPLNDPPSPTSPVKPIITGAIGSGGRRQLVPWTWFPPSANARVGWRYGTNNEPTTPRINPNQPEAREWVLARKAVLLADDGGRAIYYPEPVDLTIAGQQGASSAPSIFGDRSNGGTTATVSPNAGDTNWYFQEMRDRNWIAISNNLIPSPSVQSGWVDIAASDLDKVRREVAPTLRLASPLDLDTLTDYVQSVSLPWAVGLLGGPNVPLGWPTGVGAPAWPETAAVTIVGNNQQGGNVLAYSNQRDRLMRGTFGIPSTGTIPTTTPFFGLLGWPRSEKAAPNTDRRSELLAAPTLLTNCSSFRVDWTWEPGTGRQTDASGAVVSALTGLGYPANAANLWVMRGFEPFASGPWAAVDTFPPSVPSDQPWFGLPDGDVTLAQQAMPLVGHNGFPAEVANRHMQLVARSIEGNASGTAPLSVITPFAGQPGVRVYTAVFGFNQDEAYVVTPDGTVVLRGDYTPWPTQLRVTATIHDPRLVLDRGREVQFVLDVPKRRKD